MVSILVAVLLLGCVILVHEAGHFIAAKLVGIRVVTFSVGMGPRLWERRIGDTVFCLSAFPLGGYVRPFAKAEDGADDVPPPRLFRWLAPTSAVERQIIANTPASDPGSLLHASYPARLFFLANGLLLNLLFAYAVLLGLCYTLGSHREAVGTRVAVVEAGSPAERAGLLVGDEILAVNGTSVDRWERVAREVSHAPRDGLRIVVRVAGHHLVFVREFERLAPQARLGFRPQVRERPFTFAEAGGFAAERFVGFTRGYLHNLFTSRDAISFNMVGNLQSLGGMASGSLDSFLSMFVALSITVVLWNSIPYPAFDGGQILLLLVEWARGEELNHLLKQRLVYFGLASCLLLYVAMIGADAVDAIWP